MQAMRKFYNLIVKNLTLSKIQSTLLKIDKVRKIKNDSEMYLVYFERILLIGNRNSAIEHDGGPYGFYPV